MYRALDIWLTTSCLSAPGKVRLVNGMTQNEGFVEIFLHGQYGAICGHPYGWDPTTGNSRAWNNTEAMVVCRQLGLPWSGAKAYRGQAPDGASQFPDSTRAPGASGLVPYSVIGMQCQGSEVNVMQCPFLDIQLRIPTNWWGGSSYTCSGWDACKSLLWHHTT